MERGLVERIRAHVFATYIRPARGPGIPRTLTLVARDIHREMGLVNRMPAVCCALERGDFAERAQVTLLERLGPAQGATATWKLRVDGGPADGLR